MNILAIESCYGFCSAALAVDDTVFFKENHEVNQQSETIALLVEQTLQAANAKINTIDVIAVNIGVGSFSGTRVGISYAQGLAIALQINIIPVNTFQVIACKYYKNKDKEQQYYIGCEYKRNNFAILQFRGLKSCGDIEMYTTKNADFKKISYLCNIERSNHYPDAVGVLKAAKKNVANVKNAENIFPLYL